MTIQAPPPVFSKKFNDTYFSKVNGLEETHHVFLRGNRLPDRWEGRERFVIGETGFGTGLNFMACWELFEKTTKRGQCLDYIAAELYPLERNFLKNFLTPLFGPRTRDFLAHYPYLTPGFHRLQLTQNVALTLVFDDVCAAFDQIRTPIDAWFLDGFVPAHNPRMWRQELFDQMAALSARNASFATFTAAGFVRRGLAKAGFDVRKTKGFGTKRDMTTGRISSGRSPLEAPSTVASVAIIGAGLAGSAAAWHLNQRGITANVYEQSKHTASGASGNHTGLFNPRPFALRHARNEYHSAGLEMIARIARNLQDQEDIEYRLPGCLQLANNPDKLEKFCKAASAMGWPGDMLKMVSPGQASDIAGIKIKKPCLYSPLAGALSPPKLVNAYLKNSALFTSRYVHTLRKTDTGWELYDQNGQKIDYAEQIILTRPVNIEGYEINWRKFLRPVQGQITLMRPSAGLNKLRCNIGHGGYLTRVQNGNLLLGATFHRGRDEGRETPQDDFQNFYQMKEALGRIEAHPDFISRRASVRLTTPDHLPMAGQSGIEGIYISSGWGSHGILGTALGGAMIADMIISRADPIPKIVRQALDPIRFFKDNAMQQIDLN